MCCCAFVAASSDLLHYGSASLAAGCDVAQVRQVPNVQPVPTSPCLLPALRERCAQVRRQHVSHPARPQLTPASTRTGPAAPPWTTSGPQRSLRSAAAVLAHATVGLVFSACYCRGTAAFMILGWGTSTRSRCTSECMQITPPLFWLGSAHSMTTHPRAAAQVLMSSHDPWLAPRRHATCHCGANVHCRHIPTRRWQGHCRRHAPPRLLTQRNSEQQHPGGWPAA